MVRVSREKNFCFKFIIMMGSPRLLINQPSAIKYAQEYVYLSPFTLCFFICFFKFPFWVNFELHKSQEKGFSPRCMRAWSKKFHAFMNCLLQPEYLQWSTLLRLLGPLLGR